MPTSTLSTRYPQIVVNRPMEHAFFGLLVALVVFTVFLGFAQSYLLAGIVRAPLPSRLVHIHSAVFMSWILLLVIQVSLAAAGKLRWHRQLGMLGFVIAAAMVVLGLMTATAALAAHRTPPGFPPLAFYFGQIITIGFAFPLLVFFAFYYKKRPATHKRLILIATFAIFDAAITRWPMPAISHNLLMTSAVVYSFLLLVAAYDLFSLHRIQNATLWGGLFVIVFREARLPIGISPAWMAFCYWARSHGLFSF